MGHFYKNSESKKKKKKLSSLANFQDIMVGSVQPIRTFVFWCCGFWCVLVFGGFRFVFKASIVTITALQTLTSETCNISAN